MVDEDKSSKEDVFQYFGRWKDRKDMPDGLAFQLKLRDEIDRDPWKDTLKS